MTEPIKQEIINNIFENGDKLITGPILQTVLIDMIDDVNVKDQEILSKTGSWDEAVTQIPNLATKAEVTNLSESIARDLENVDVDLTGYATEQWVQNQGYLTEHQDISNLATKGELNAAKDNLQGNITSLSESVARDIASVPEGVATEEWVQSQGYLKEHQDISGLATKTELTEAENNLQGNITSLSESVARDLANVDVDLTGYATETWVQNQDYASKSYVDNAVSSSSVDLTGYATETWVESQGYLKEHQDISGLATKTELNSVSESIQTDISNLATKTELNDTKNNLQGNITSLSESVARDLTGYATETWVQNQGYLTEHQDISGLATKGELTSVSESVQTDITNLSESVANSAVWKKGTGTDSIVQKLTETGLIEPIATGKGAIATGYNTNASGGASHAEGEGTKALDAWSHAEGNFTVASGRSSHAEGEETVASSDGSHAEGTGSKATGAYSHAEGGYTTTSNWYEHAQGRYNHNSENQIFSVGTGNSDTDRRNAVSVLEVSNNNSYTSSFFVQNIGGYDGTNPLPGTNDLATVINSLPSGGSSETLWKKGEGQDSVVQVLTGDNEAYTPTATGIGAVAIGSETTASGQASHAEGANTTASGDYSHAEGLYTTAFGQASHAEGDHTNAFGDYSHAEGYQTEAPNSYECALGMCNHSSEGQIFSVGAGEGDPYNPFDPKPITRRNAISVLAVPNSDTQINTASVFVQNVGGYDGTNPLPGTNDLATVINGMSSGGGSSETLWKKGTGQDSLVQAIASGTNLPTATGERAIATGNQTQASNYSSHAEGQGTKASGSYSHAEGFYTVASGDTSHAEGLYTEASGPACHAEGYHTVASNQIEHAQGRYNHNSENQIFSIGTGNSDTDRRNAVSVLEVSNNNSYTSSFFVQNIGGYDGTNPLPGTNDLATVINGMSTGGGESGDYLPLTGGTLTGDLRVNSSMGVGTGPQGTYCLAVGNSSTNTGGSHYALAVGENCQVDGAYGGVSLGRENVVNAAFGLATGFRCRTTYMAGYAGGCRSTASANFAFAAGFGAEATRVGQVVLGAYNELDPSGDNESTGSYAVILANGKSSTWHQDRPGSITRSNGLAIKWDGGIDIKYQGSTVTLQDKLNEIEAKISSGGTATSTETWTFTLDDGSTVTKNILMA